MRTEQGATRQGLRPDTISILWKFGVMLVVAIAIALALLALAVIFYAATIVWLGGNVASRKF